MERKLKICKRCKKERLIWARGMCYTCDAKTKIENGTMNTIKRTSIKPKANKGNLEQIFLETIISTKKHVSFLTGLPIEKLDYSNCHHVLAKGQYPKFRLYDKNIVLLSQQEHFLIHSGTGAQRLLYSFTLKSTKNTMADWAKLFALRDELLLEYAELK